VSDTLDWYCEQTRTSKSDTVSRAIDEYIKSRLPAMEGALKAEQKAEQGLNELEEEIKKVKQQATTQ
jgi:hypothetical protein